MTIEKLAVQGFEFLCGMVLLIVMMLIIYSVYEAICNFDKKVKPKNNKDQGKFRVPFGYGEVKEQAEHDAKNDTYNNCYKDSPNKQKHAGLYEQSFKETREVIVKDRAYDDAAQVVIFENGAALFTPKLYGDFVKDSEYKWYQEAFVEEKSRLTSILEDERMKVKVENLQQTEAERHNTDDSLMSRKEFSEEFQSGISNGESINHEAVKTENVIRVVKNNSRSTLPFFDFTEESVSVSHRLAYYPGKSIYDQDMNEDHRRRNVDQKIAFYRISLLRVSRIARKHADCDYDQLLPKFVGKPVRILLGARYHPQAFRDELFQKIYKEVYDKAIVEYREKYLRRASSVKKAA